MKKVLFTLGLFLFYSIYSQNELIDKILQKDVIGMEDPNGTTIISDPNNYNAHGYYETEIKPEQLDSIHLVIEQKLRINSLTIQDLQLDSQRIWKKRIATYLAREVKYSINNITSSENVPNGLAYFDIDSSNSKQLYSNYSYLFKEKLNSPFEYAYNVLMPNDRFSKISTGYNEKNKDTIINHFYNSLKDLKDLQNNIDDSFYGILSRYQQDKIWVLDKIIQYEEFYYKNSNDLERFKKRLEDITKYVREAPFSNKEKLYSGLALCYFHFDWATAYKLYLHSIKEPVIYSPYKYEAYDFYPYINITKILSEFNDDYYFINKITTVLGERIDKKFNDPYLLKQGPYFYSNYDYLLLKGSFELQKLSFIDFENKELIEAGIFSKLVDYYIEAQQQKLNLAPFVLLTVNSTIAKYIRSYYTKFTIASLYYNQLAFDNSLIGFSNSKHYSIMLDSYIYSLIENGFYNQADELLKKSTDISIITQNDFSFFAAKQNLIKLYLKEDRIDDALKLLSELESKFNKSPSGIYGNYLAQCFFMAKISVAEKLNDSSSLLSGQLGGKQSETNHIYDYSGFEKAEMEYYKEVREDELNTIIETKNKMVEQLDSSLTNKELELKQKNDSLKGLNTNIKFVTDKLSITSATLANKSDSLTKADSLIQAISKQISKLRLDSTNLATKNTEAQIRLNNKEIKIKGLEATNTTTTRIAIAFGVLSFILAIIATIYARKERKERKLKEGKNIELQKTIIELHHANEKLSAETEEKIKATSEAELYKSDFLRKRLDIHHMKGGLPSLAIQIDFINNAIQNTASIKQEIKHKVAEITTMSEKLKDYVKECISNSKEQIAPIQREIDNARNYIDLFNLDSTFKMSPLSTSDRLNDLQDKILFPTNLLQPIIQNCITHAFHKRDGIMNRVINIDVEPNQDGSHTLIISDNGIGIEKNVKQEVNKGSSGISLNDITNYLSILRKQKATNIYFDFQNCITLNPSGNGTSVKFLNLTI